MRLEANASHVALLHLICNQLSIGHICSDKVDDAPHVKRPQRLWAQVQQPAEVRTCMSLSWIHIRLIGICQDVLASSELYLQLCASSKHAPLPPTN